MPDANNSNLVANLCPSRLLIQYLIFFLTSELIVAWTATEYWDQNI